MKAKVLVATHKDAPMPKDPVYLPILVGADRNFKGQKGYQLDNTGTNISRLNPNYNELTAVYWAFKNLPDVDAVGLVHYRRLFSKTHKRDLEHVLTSAEVAELLEKAPVVLPKKRHYVIETIYSHYVHSHHEQPLINLRNVIKQDYPDYLSSFDQVLNRRSAHMFNMFIMKKTAFDDYCEFIFPVLFKVQEQTDISNYSVQEARVYGYLSELLMDVWVTKNQVKFVECNWVQIGDRQLIKKAWGFLKRKFQNNDDKNQVNSHF
ncbi:DUF4422 domain-containing protein [Fructilactobacillus hinvesii]|uniref:DUF4422 domain-containing protein n=1 Tax=Fructilactobacillus hinvesii TaxID=2940300 RepID=A0ABY5BX54_9LACO|nr:DUF4422 domain-containing protein [Fructilactobacillus hinvesii]USS88566.1 DUF4422 domain-containing protein [Fructilactobacillus hinvesii]